MRIFILSFLVVGGIMDLPFDYIVFYLFGTLKYRNKKTIIKKNNLQLCLIKLIAFLDISEEVQREFVDEFDLNEEINTLVDNYFEYFDYDGDYLILDSDVSVSDIDGLLLSIKDNYDEEFIEDIKMEIDNNYEFLELLGIKIQKQIAHNLMYLEQEIEEAYNDFSKKANDSKFYYNLKRLLFKRKIFNMAIKNNMDTQEYYDICIYISNLSDDLYENNVYLDFMVDDDFAIQDTIKNNPYLNAIFFKEGLALLNIVKKIDMDASENDARNLKFSENKFYATFLKYLSEEMSNVSSRDLYYEFRTCKYRLMNVLDSVCDTLYIMGDKKDAFDDFNFKEDYSFIDNIVFFFIDEILMYDDEKYAYDKDNFFNLVNHYYNIVKKILIKTYYYLTQNDRVIDAIKNNPLYGVNKISTGLLDDVINGDNRKKTKKRN